MLSQALNALKKDRCDYEQCSAVQGDSTQTRLVPGSELAGLLSQIERTALRGAEASVEKQSGLIDTYYAGRPTKWRLVQPPQGQPQLHPALHSPLVHVDDIEYAPLPLFLEGQVHRLRLLRDKPEASKQLCESVRNSGLYDAALRRETNIKQPQAVQSLRLL